MLYTILYCILLYFTLLCNSTGTSVFIVFSYLSDHGLFLRNLLSLLSELVTNGGTLYSVVWISGLDCRVMELGLHGLNGLEGHRVWRGWHTSTGASISPGSHCGWLGWWIIPSISQKWVMLNVSMMWQAINCLIPFWCIEEGILMSMNDLGIVPLARLICWLEVQFVIYGLCDPVELQDPVEEPYGLP